MDHARIAVRPTVPIDDDEALAQAYTPGVADACQAIAEDPGAARSLTTRGNSVAVISDGSAVLGLGDLGPLGALPVLEGKAALLRRFAGIDAWPLCLNAGAVGDNELKADHIVPSVFDEGLVPRVARAVAEESG